MLRSALSCNHRRFPRQIHLKVYFSSTALTANNKPPPKHNDKINYNPDISFSNTVDPKHLQYPMLSSRDLESHRKPPTRVRMLIRDFIEDSLYNPHYGYFSKRATIFTAPPHCGGVEGGFDFNKYRDSAEFEVDVAKRYMEFGNGEEDGPGRQLWHTPTELFKVGNSFFVFWPRYLMYAIAMVWASDSPVPSIRVLAQILPLRRLQGLRAGSRKWHVGAEHPGFSKDALPRGI